MEQLTNKLSKEVVHQLPSFVKENYETFIAFLQAYYEYMEQSGKTQDVIRNAKSYLDIDETLDEFVEYFLNQYAFTIPKAIFGDSSTDSKRLFVKYATNLYKTKGSEAAYRLLFRLLYNEEITFFYPNQYLFKPSSGLWNTRVSVKTEYTSGIPASNISGSYVRGATSNSFAVVDYTSNYEEDGVNVYELFLVPETITGEFSGGETLTVGANLATLTALNVVSEIEILDSGRGYVKTDQVYLSNAGSTFCTIDSLDIDGSIKSIGVGQFSISLTGDAVVATIDPPSRILLGDYTVSGNIATIVFSDKHYLSTGEFANVEFLSGNATVESGQLQIKDTVGLRAFQVDSNVGNTSGTVSLTYNDTANIRAKVGTICYYKGTYGQTFQGQTDHEIKLQDSEFYQQFSYVIRSNIGIDQWRDVIKSVLHPAGLALFGELFIQSDLGEESIYVGADNAYDVYVSFVKLLISDTEKTFAGMSETTLQEHRIIMEPVLSIESGAVVIGPTRNTVDRFAFFYDDSTPMSEFAHLPVSYFTEHPNRNRSWYYTPPGEVVFATFIPPEPETDPFYANVYLLLHGEGTDGSNVIVDSSPLNLTPLSVSGNVALSSLSPLYGESSIQFSGNGGIRYSYIGDYWYVVSDVFKTFEVTFKFENGVISDSNYRYIMYIGNGGWHHFYVAGKQGKLLVGTTSGTEKLLADITDNTEYHLVVGFVGEMNAKGIALIWLNGQLLGSYQPQFGIGTADLIFGCWHDNNYGFVGKMDEIRVSGTAQRYLLAIEQPTTDPTLDANTSIYISCEGSNGSSPVDSSPAAHSLTLTGVAPTITTSTSAVGSSSLSFTAGNGYIRIPADSLFDFGTEDWTIEFYMRYSGVPQNSPGIIQTDSSSAGFIRITNYPGLNSALRFFTSDGISNYILTLRDTNTKQIYNPNDGEWHHIAFCKTKDTVFGWFDGNFAGAIPMPTGFSFGVPGADLLLGYNPVDSGGVYFNGGLDRIHIKKGVAIYDQDFTPPTRPFPDE